MKLFKIISLLALIFFLTACGQSGPLYLPGHQTTTTIPAQTKDY